MASYRKLPNGKGYKATIYLGLDENKKQIRKHINRPTLKEAKEAVKQFESKYRVGVYGSFKMRFSDYAEEWLLVNKNRLSTSTVVLYEIYITKHFNPVFGKMRLEQITELHIRRFLADKHETNVPNTVRKLFFVLRKILQDGMKGQNPCAGVQSPEKKKYIPRLLSDNEFEKIRADVKETEHEIIILLAAWCGLRRGEIFALEWKDIDWTSGTIKIDETLAITSDKTFKAKRPKSDNGFRDVVAPKYLLYLLQERRVKQKVITKRIFSRRPDCYSSTFADLRKKYGWPPIRFHDLRHYHASWLYNKGIPDQYAAQRLGHDIQTLKTIYQHIGADRKDAIDSKIKKLFDG